MASVTVLLLISSVFPAQGEICSLYYTYSAILKSLSSRDIYEFYSSVELNDIQMNFCNSVNKADFLIQLCEKSERLFRNETDDLNYKREWLQININTLMETGNDNRTSVTDLHILQWRHGCAAECHSNGSVIFLQGTDEYAYNGDNLTFNLSKHWKPLVLEHGIIWNRESVSRLERKCVETLTSFNDLQRDRKFSVASHPEVYSSVKASGSSEQQVLVCLATGFYPKHVQMEIRRDQTPLPDEQLNSSGIRPNADGSFQLKKSLKILPSERSRYQCVVKHQTLTEPLIISWDEVNVLLPVITGLLVAFVVLAIILFVFYLLRKCFKYQKSLKTQTQLVRGMGSYCNNGNVADLGFMGNSFFAQEKCAGLAAALNDSSDEENTADDNLQEVQTKELHETQSLCEPKETPAAAPTAARGAIGSKYSSLPNFAMEIEDTYQNTVTQNALWLPLPRRCRSKLISLPNLALD
uniref:Ig-like domain-containing protein n=1 Tax=Cyprinus carpio carpio TaxID=630221 RepID=A0A9J7X961_CYPCA